MASNKAVYFKGIRLWENLKHWKPTLQRGGGTRKNGLARRLGKLSAHSPNFFYEIVVHTDVKPAVLTSDLGYQEVFNLQMLQVQKDLVEQSNSLGDLSWCQDVSEVLTVGAPFSMPGSYPGTGSWTYSGSGFVPAVGQYVLLRNPETGDGFVTLLTTAGGGTAAGILKQEITADWEMIRVRFFFPSTAFVTMGGWETAVQAEDRHAFDVPYAFESEAHPVYPDAYLMDIT